MSGTGTGSDGQVPRMDETLAMPMEPGAAMAQESDGPALSAALGGLPNYEIEIKLGEGGMGAVYRARQISLSRTVAIKVLPKHLAQNPKYVARLNREAIVLAKLNHPNVIGCFDMGEHQGMRYVVMEYVEGQTLGQLVEKRKFLPQSEALAYLKQAVLGLEHANALGVIHRDIKPENMLLAKPPSAGSTRRHAGQTLKIADLGLAALTVEGSENTRLTMEGSTMGTPHFMSIEQTLAEPDLDFRTDIYALGITLYNMVTGILPHSAPTVAAIISKKLTEHIPDPRTGRPELTPGLALLIQKMTARKKEDRYASYEALLHDIEALEKDLPLAAEILPNERACVTLGNDTIEALKAMGSTILADYRGKLPGQGQVAATPASKKSPVALYTVGGIVIAAGITGAILMAIVKPKNNEVPSLIPANNTTPISVQPPIVPTPPVTSKAPESIPIVKPVEKMTPSTPAAAVVFTTQSLIEDHSIKGWTYSGDAKDFGFEDGALFLQSMKKDWNMAQRMIPSGEYTLRVLARIPTDTDDCEVQIGIAGTDYIAFGVRLPAGAQKAVGYAEKRDAKDHHVLEVLSTKDGLNPDDWQELRVNVWGGQATCFLFNKFMVSAELSPGAEESKRVRIAACHGIAQFQILEISPRPETK